MITKRIIMSIIGLLALFLSVPAFAQDTSTPYDAYFVTVDDSEIHQVWGLALESNTLARLTNAAESVYNYAISRDASQIAYISGGQLWLQVNDAPAEPLLTITEDPARVTLAFSPDGQSLAYGNGGVSIMTLSTRATRDLIADSPEKDPQNLRDYSPGYFLDADRLLINVGLWEGGTLAFYSFSTQMIQEVDGYFDLVRLTLLEDGRYLVYSPSRRGSVEAFLLGEPSENALVPFALNAFLVDQFAAQGLMGVVIDDTVELLPGRIRFIGSGMPNQGEPTIVSFIAEYDFNTEELVVNLDASEYEPPAWLGDLSPDGMYRAGLSNSQWTDRGPEGSLVIADVDTNTPLTLPLLPPVGFFQWSETSPAN